MRYSLTIIDTKSIKKKMKQEMRLFSFEINYEIYIIFHPIPHIILSNMEVIPNSSTVRDLYLTLANTAEEEILLIFQTTNAFIRHEKIGVIQVTKKVARGSTFVFNLPIRDKKTQSFRILG